MPDGTMLIVSMLDRLLLSWDSAKGVLSEHANLFPLASFHCNDMVVDSTGRAYVGNFGFDLHAKGFLSSLKFYTFLLLYKLLNQTHTWLLKGAELICVEPDGKARIVARDLMFPNGCVITPDGKVLIVAETMGARLTAFDIDEKGDLSNRRVWARLPPGGAPDGICLDEAGGVWVASLTTKECIRLTEGSEGAQGVTHRVSTQQPAFACMLGGPDGKTLFICTAPSHYKEECEKEGRRGRVEYCKVPYARAGCP